MEAHEPLLHENVKDLFPFGQVRDGQRQFLDDARSCMANRVNLLVHAPTGLGKTAVALTASLETTLAEEGTTFFLTARQSQHEAAVETARHIWRKERFGLVDIISREASCLCRSRDGRMPCLESGDCYFLDQGRIGEAAHRLLDYPLHVGEAQRLCVRIGACPYLAAMEALPSADVVVCDINQVFDRDAGSFIDRCATPTDGICLVVDEAHNLPGRITENRSVSISRAIVSGASKATGHRNFKTALQTLLRYIDSCVFDLVRPLPGTDLDDRLREAVGMDAATLADEMESYYQGRMRRRMAEIVAFLRGWNAYGEASLRFADPAEGVLHSRFMEPGIVCSSVLEKVRCALLMSGTLHPPELFADLLGMTDTAVCRRYPSPFPEQNRLILGIDGVTSRYDQRGERTYDSMAELVLHVCEAVPGNIALFAPSYEMLGQLEGRLRPRTNKRLLTERKNMAKAEKDALLYDLRRGRNGLLMATVSGSFAEGVDFKDNILSSVIVVGLPLSPPSMETCDRLERLSKRMDRHKANLYVKTYPAVTKVLQAAGRAIRSETDRASIILLDERYLDDRVRGSFPSDFRIAHSVDLTAELTEFHGTEAEGQAPAPIDENVITAERDSPPCRS